MQFMQVMLEKGGGGVRGRMMRRRRYVPWGNDDQNCLEDDAK